MENIVLAVFNVESEAYQAMTELRQEPIRVGSVVSQAILVTNQNDRIKVEDTFDTGYRTSTTLSGLASINLAGFYCPLSWVFSASFLR